MGRADRAVPMGNADGRADGWCQWQYRWAEQTVLQTEVHMGRSSGKVNATNRAFCSDWEGMQPTVPSPPPRGFLGLVRTLTT